MPRTKLDRLVDEGSKYPDKGTPIDKLNPDITWEDSDFKKIPSSPFVYAPDGSVHLDPEIFKMYKSQV